MITFHVPDMTCGACASRIGQALTQASLPAGLQVDIDVTSREVRIPHEGPTDTAQAVERAIRAAGYSVQPVMADASGGRTTRKPACCCAPHEPVQVDANQGRPLHTAACCD